MESTNVEDKEKEAKNLMREGNYQKAVDLLSEILEQRVAKFGETAIECAPIYYQYGKSLLAFAQSEIDVLGGIMKKKTWKKQLGNKLGISDDDDDEEEEEEKPNLENTAELLEMAWEVLELARLIYSNVPEYKLELAEVFLVIGDLSMESDNMEQAVLDYAQCLSLREKLLPPEDRRLAETHYSMGLAQEYQHKVKEALEHYSMAHKILGVKVSELKLSEKEEIDAEVSDLQAILEELAAKIEDLSKGEKVTLPFIDNNKPHQFDTPTLQTNEIQDLGVFGGKTMPTKRKAQVLEVVANDADNSKKVKLTE